MLARHQHAVLALPAQPGGSSQVLRCKTHTGELPKDRTIAIYIEQAHVEVLSHDDTAAELAATPPARA